MYKGLNLKIGIDVNNFGRLAHFNLYTETPSEDYPSDPYANIFSVAKPMQLEMVRLNPMEIIEEPTLKLPHRELIGMFKSFETEMLRHNLVVPKIESADNKNETIAVLKNTIELLKEENARLHFMNNQLMEVVKPNVRTQINRNRK